MAVAPMIYNAPLTGAQEDIMVQSKDAIQRPVERFVQRRIKGFNLPENTVCVSRPSRWGNPFKVTPDRTQAEAVTAFRTWLIVDGCHANMPEKKKWILDNLPKLKGKNLACYCKQGTACHADVLIELANV